MPIDPRWTWHRKILCRLRDKLLRDRAEKFREAAAPIGPHSMHEADSATDEFDHNILLTLLAAGQNALIEVNDAILRIHAGRYGRCEISGKPIPRRRLRAAPWARYTVEVERQLEKSGALPAAHLYPAVSLQGAEAGLPKDETIHTETELPEPRMPEMFEFATEGESEPRKTIGARAGFPASATTGNPVHPRNRERGNRGNKRQLRNTSLATQATGRRLA